MKRFVQFREAAAVMALGAALTAPSALAGPDADDSVDSATSANPIAHLKDGYRQFARSDTVALLGCGMTVALASFVFLDRAARDYFAGHARLGGWEAVGNFYGMGIVGGSLGAVSIGYGALMDRPRELHAGISHLESLALNGLTVQVVKMTVQRERPDRSDRWSFPSGHTSTAFVTAGNLHAHYGPWVSAPALALGVFTALSRMASHKHYLSDTVAGATLGLSYGIAFGRHHLRESGASDEGAETPTRESRLVPEILPEFTDRRNWLVNAVWHL